MCTGGNGEHTVQSSRALVSRAARPCYASRVVHVAADVSAFLRQREVHAYEQRVARSAYAYGVDLRRVAWLETSTFGDPLMRGVDRQWNALVADLSGSILQDPARAAPVTIMEEIARISRLLRAPSPTLRLLVRGLDRWPVVTPLGTTKGALHWLVIDPERLLALPAYERTFLLGSALADLQCDHGPLWTAHLIAERADRATGLLKTVLRPWSKVAVFSADRGGLIATGDLAKARAALATHGAPPVPWIPPRPALALRDLALCDFDRSTTMARLRVLLERHRRALDERPGSSPGNEASVASGSAAGVDLGPAKPQAATVVPGAAPNLAGGTANASTAAPTADATPPRAGGDPYREAAADATSSAREEPDEEMTRALAEAWSLARCDARLTRRLGLL